MIIIVLLFIFFLYLDCADKLILETILQDKFFISRRKLEIQITDSRLFKKSTCWYNMLPECFLFTSFSCNTLHRIVVCKQELCRDIMNIGGLYHNFFQAAFIFCAFCYFLLLFLFDEIEIYTSDSSFFILHVIPHITTALCNLTGFCN